jgi:hypothetical protein
MPDLRVMPAEQVADAVTRLMRVRWSWLIADVDRLVDQLGWPLEQPAAHGVAYLSTGYQVAHGAAMVMYRGEMAESVVVGVTGRLERRFPDRLGAFANVVAAVAGVLGPPTDRRPGLFPEVWWPATDGLVGVSDDRTYIDLELRSARFEAPLAAGRELTRREREFKALNPDWDQDDEDDILANYPPL